VSVFYEIVYVINVFLTWCDIRTGYMQAARECSSTFVGLPSEFRRNTQPF
jgi:hypothetical protein